MQGSQDVALTIKKTKSQQSLEKKILFVSVQYMYWSKLLSEVSEVVIDNISASPYRDHSVSGPREWCIREVGDREYARSHRTAYD